MPSDRPACWLGHVPWHPVQKIPKIWPRIAVQIWLLIAAKSITKFPLPLLPVWGHVHQLRQPASEKPVSHSLSFQGVCLTNWKRRKCRQNITIVDLGISKNTSQGTIVLQDPCLPHLLHICTIFETGLTCWEKIGSRSNPPRDNLSTPWKSAPRELCHVCPHFGVQGTSNRTGGFKKIGLLTAQRQPIEKDASVQCAVVQ